MTQIVCLFQRKVDGLQSVLESRWVGEQDGFSLRIRPVYRAADLQVVSEDFLGLLVIFR